MVPEPDQATVACEGKQIALDARTVPETLNLAIAFHVDVGRTADSIGIGDDHLTGGGRSGICGAQDSTVTIDPDLWKRLVGL